MSRGFEISVVRGTQREHSLNLIVQSDQDVRDHSRLQAGNSSSVSLPSRDVSRVGSNPTRGT